MIRTLTCLASIILATVGSGALVVADDSPPPSFSGQIQPLLSRYCVECHNADDPENDLVVETYAGLLKGGQRGPALVAGKPDQSRLVLQLEGKVRPNMPPKGSPQPTPVEIALVRAWVAAGAKADSSTAATLPAIQPRGKVAPKITAAVYTVDGAVLIVAAYREVLLLNPADRTLLGKLTGYADPVTALCVSRDGTRLAVVTGAPKQHGNIHIYRLPGPPVPPDLEPYKSIQAHGDLIHDIAFSPSGKLLATCGYDRLVKLWNPETGGEVKTLKDHSDAVYALAFSPDGRLLASAAADRAVKVWEVVTGRRLYTLGEATDWVYAVAWSPDGKYLAAGGVDKSIRVWHATPSGGRLLHSTFAHEAAILRLVYSADSKTLYSLSEDRTVKAWDAGRMVERLQYPRQSEVTLALAVRPDSQQIALGRYDGVVSIFDAAEGKRLGDLIAVAEAKPAPKPEPPVLISLRPRGARRGQTVRLTLEGKHLNWANELVTSLRGVKPIPIQRDEPAESLPPSRSGATESLLPSRRGAKESLPPLARGGKGGSTKRAWADLTIPADAALGLVSVWVNGPLGESAKLPFAVTTFPETAETGSHDTQSTAQPISLPVTIAGAVLQAGQADYYRFRARAGQQLGIELLASRIGSKLTPVLTLLDASGHSLAEAQGATLGYTSPRDATYWLRVRDVEYRGSDAMFYRINLGDIPVVSSLFPLGLARGSAAEIELRGVNLGNLRRVKVQASADAKVGSRVTVPVKLADGRALAGKSVVVGEFREISEQGSNNEPAEANLVSTPVTINGRIEKPGDVDVFRFTARKGQRLILDVNARRLGSPLDSNIEILDSESRLLHRATLRSLAKTYTVFRDHDAQNTGMRIESWRELAINDYVLVGDELLRIKALPRNPDDNAQFFNEAGRRVGFLGTTPTFQSKGTPLYRVAIHPPGARFPPNGMPVVTVYYRNDDGGARYDKDSRLFFDPPGDAEYLVRIGDVRGHGGPEHAYRLAIRPPRPSFNVSFSPKRPSVWKSGAVPIKVSCQRIDGFDGPIEVRLKNLPKGFSAPETTILVNENSTALALSAEPDAATPDKDTPRLKLLARAQIAGRVVVREVTGEHPRAVEPGDIVTRVDRSEVTIRPGGQSKLTVHVERRGGFKGRVPIDVRGLPHGTRVLDIGLNGILITERETSRTITLYCESWVRPIRHPIVVLARHEGKKTEHAARSVLLTVAPDRSVAEAPPVP